MNIRKQISFDLNVNELKKNYPYENYENAYAEIKSFMKKHDFLWRQGSVYTSNKPLSMAKTVRTIEELIDRHPWLNMSMRDCTVTDINKEYELNYLFEKNYDFKSKTYEIVKDIKSAGYRPTKRLVSNMEKVNDAVGKQCSIRNLRNEVKKHLDNATLKKAAEGAIKELNRQDHLKTEQQPVNEPLQYDRI